MSTNFQSQQINMQRATSASKMQTEGGLLEWNKEVKLMTTLLRVGGLAISQFITKT